MVNCQGVAMEYRMYHNSEQKCTANAIRNHVGREDIKYPNQVTQIVRYLHRRDSYWSVMTGLDGRIEWTALEVHCS